MQDVQEKVLKIVNELFYFGVDIELDMKLTDDLHADSLELVELEIKIQEEFGFEIELDEYSTINNVCELVVANLN